MISGAAESNTYSSSSSSINVVRFVSFRESFHFSQEKRWKVNAINAYIYIYIYIHTWVENRRVAARDLNRGVHTLPASCTLPNSLATDKYVLLITIDINYVFANVNHFISVSATQVWIFENKGGSGVKEKGISNDRLFQSRSDRYMYR